MEPKIFICRDKNTDRLRIFIGEQPTLNEQGVWCNYSAAPEDFKVSIPHEMFPDIEPGCCITYKRMITSDEITDKILSLPPLSQTKPKRRCRNDLTQFEIKSKNDRDIRAEYDWCVENLPLKEEHGLMYHVTEFFIITRSQRVIDKVNCHFGSAFSFKNWLESRMFYID